MGLADLLLLKHVLTLALVSRPVGIPALAVAGFSGLEACCPAHRVEVEGHRDKHPASSTTQFCFHPLPPTPLPTSLHSPKQTLTSLIYSNQTPSTYHRPCPTSSAKPSKPSRAATPTKIKAATPTSKTTPSSRTPTPTPISRVATSNRAAVSSPR